MEGLIQLILSGAYHLESFANDAVDSSRIESNQFRVSKALFKVTEVVKEVQDIMNFQFEQKNLKLIV